MIGEQSEETEIVDRDSHQSGRQQIVTQRQETRESGESSRVKSVTVNGIRSSDQGSQCRYIQPKFRDGQIIWNLSFNKD